MNLQNFKLSHFFGVVKIIAVIIVRFAIKRSWI